MIDCDSSFLQILIVIIASCRILLKPISDFLTKFSNLTNFEFDNKIAKVIIYLIDWIASIDLKKRK